MAKVMIMVYDQHDNSFYANYEKVVSRVPAIGEKIVHKPEGESTQVYQVIDVVFDDDNETDVFVKHIGPYDDFLGTLINITERI